MKLEESLNLKRCPHCQIANPGIVTLWPPTDTHRSDGGHPNVWAGFRCTTCGSVICVQCEKQFYGEDLEIEAIFPQPKTAHSDIPVVARTFLQQAYETLHAPDAAAVMAGSAVDAMLKDLGYVKGSVYERINDAVDDHTLTLNMGEWAHSVRLGSNRPRHADAEKPHVSPKEALQSVEFAEALGQFLFVLTAKIKRGIEKAQEGLPKTGGDKLGQAIAASLPKQPKS